MKKIFAIAVLTMLFSTTSFAAGAGAIMEDSASAIVETSPKTSGGNYRDKSSIEDSASAIVEPQAPKKASQPKASPKTVKKKAQNSTASGTSSETTQSWGKKETVQHPVEIVNSNTTADQTRTTTPAPEKKQEVRKTEPKEIKTNDASILGYALSSLVGTSWFGTVLKRKIKK